MRLLTASLAVAAAIAQVVSSIGNDEPLVKTPGDIAAIRGWYMQSTAKTSTDMINVSKPGFDVASWYRVGSYGTVMVRVTFPMESCLCGQTQNADQGSNRLV
jgi:exo-1,4-beta-D-glucosaminidase